MGEVSLNRCMYTKPMKERFGLRNKYVPNPRNHAAEWVPQARYTFNTPPGPVHLTGLILLRLSSLYTE